MKSFILAALLLFVPAVAFSAEGDDMVGKKFWIKDDVVPLSFYADCGYAGTEGQEVSGIHY